MRYSLKLCHFYPDLLNLYGDFGNILALMNRASLHDIELTYHSLLLGEKVSLNTYDIFFIGGGQDSEQTVLIKDFMARRDDFMGAIEDNRLVLGICGGYQLMGKRFITADGVEIPGLEVLNVETRAGKERLIGNTIYEADFLDNKSDESKYIYGFENHSGRTYLDASAVPMAKVLKGYGNNDERLYEGCIYKNVFATYSHGSLLPKNPALTDYLLEKAIEARYQEQIKLPYILNKAEKLAREAFLKKVAQ